MKFSLLACFFVIAIINKTNAQHVNPAILQDTRDLPKVDGAFGFLYRTEDGIAHAAKGDPDGAVRGRFTYTDPTGLKVNFNYNAGARATPKNNPNAGLSASPKINYNEPLPSVQQPRYTQTSNNVNYDNNYNNQQNNNPVTYEDNQNYNYEEERRSRPPHLRGNTANNY